MPTPVRDIAEARIKVVPDRDAWDAFTRELDGWLRELPGKVSAAFADGLKDALEQAKAMRGEGGSAAERDRGGDAAGDGIADEVREIRDMLVETNRKMDALIGLAASRD